MKFIMEDLHAKDNGIGNTMYTLFQYRFRTTIMPKHHFHDKQFATNYVKS
jgi:hypothetical protein